MNEQKALSRATWQRVDGWPHLEYPHLDGYGDGTIRWPRRYVDRAGMPMWRCARCKGFVPLKEPGSRWDKHNPCENRICKAWFALRWPDKARGWIDESS